jgi:TRAP-type C4-dicarboxylate transport system permease small subunit
MSATQKIGKIFDKVVDFMLLAAAIIIVFDAVAVSQDVIIRKFFDFTWSPLYEIMEFTLLWFTFLGTTALMRAQTHVRMDSLSSRFPHKAQAMLSFVTSTACSLLLVGICIYTVKLLIFDIQTNFVLSTILNEAKWPIEIIIPIGFICLLVQMIRNAAGFLKTYQTTRKPAPADQPAVPSKEQA